MKSAMIHFFSGTGNSKYVAETISKELKKENYYVNIHNIEDGNYNKNNIYDLHIFLFPVYATSMPSVVRKYIKKLPPGNNAKTVVLSVNGRISTRFRDGHQGWVLHQARIYLYLRKYNVFISNTFDFPHNVTIAIPACNLDNNKKIIAIANKQVMVMVEKIIKNVNFHRKILFFNFFWSIPFGILYSLIGRRVIGKLFLADSKCNNCKFCINNCPVKTIKEFHKNIRWSLNCEGCLRCINGCPNNAIQISAVKIIVLIVVLFANPIEQILSFKIVFLNSRLSIIVNYLLNNLTELSFIFLLMSLLDYVLYLLACIPGVKKILFWGHTGFLKKYNIRHYIK